jgi:hypothetical protein
MAPPERSAEALIAAWRSLPRVDLTELRRDLDELIDPDLPLSTADARDVAGIPSLEVGEVRLTRSGTD